MANILVTGGAGYVGSVCCAELLRLGHSLVVVDDLPTGFREAVPREAVFYRENVADTRAMRTVFSENRIDAVLHFAAKGPRSRIGDEPRYFLRTECGLGHRIPRKRYALRGVKKFVFSSSAAVYGQPQRVPIQEEDAKTPSNAYGETKLMLERVLHWYVLAYGWNVVALRYFNAAAATDTSGEQHDPETHIIPLLLATAAGERDVFTIYGDDYDTPDGTCVRDYVHVSDIASAHILALELPEGSGMCAYNIGCGRAYSVREVIGTVEEVTGKEISVRFGPRRLGDPAVLCASPAKLMRELNWKPRASDLRHIVRSAWEWKLGGAMRHSSRVPELVQKAG